MPMAARTLVNFLGLWVIFQNSRSISVCTICWSSTLRELSTTQYSLCDITLESSQYSFPLNVLGESVWVRVRIEFESKYDDVYGFIRAGTIEERDYSLENLDNKVSETALRTLWLWK